MLKQAITYTDFDDVEQTEVLYFNISKTELADNLSLEARFQSVSDMMAKAGTKLTIPQVTEILDLVKTVMKLAYGVRSEDGKKFRKSEELWADFKDSAVYDAYLYSLFENPEKANEFLLGVLPQDLRKQAQEQAAVPAPADDLSDEELLAMDPQKMTQPQLVRAMQLRMQ